MWQGIKVLQEVQAYERMLAQYNEVKIAKGAVGYWSSADSVDDGVVETCIRQDDEEREQIAWNKVLAAVESVREASKASEGPDLAVFVTAVETFISRHASIKVDYKGVLPTTVCIT